MLKSFQLIIVNCFSVYMADEAQVIISIGQLRAITDKIDMRVLHLCSHTMGKATTS